jgi:hypothetical protein
VININEKDMKKIKEILQKKKETLKVYRFTNGDIIV